MKEKFDSLVDLWIAGERLTRQRAVTETAFLFGVSREQAEGALRVAAFIEMERQERASAIRFLP